MQGGGGGGAVKGAFSVIKMCGTSLYKLGCDFDADPADRRPRRLGEGNYPKDIFSKCSVTQDGIELAEAQITQEAVEECALELKSDAVNGDNAKYHYYVSTLTVLDGPKAAIMLKVKQTEDLTSNNTGENDYLHSFGDVDISWSKCNH